MIKPSKAVAAALFLLLPTGLVAQDTLLTPANVSRVIDAGGIILGTALSRDTRYKMPPSNLAPEAQSAALNQLVFRVGVIQSRAASEKHENELTRAKYDVVQTIGVSLAVYAPGPWTLGGAAVASLGKLSANIYLDNANQKIESKALRQVTNYIAASRQDILDDLGLDTLTDISDAYGEGAEGRAKLEDKLRTANTVFQDLRERATAAGKPELAGAMQDMMIDVLAEITPTIVEQVNQTHAQVQGNTEDITKLKKQYVDMSSELSALETQVQSNYAELTASVSQVDMQVREVSASLSDLTDTVSKLDQRQAVIADFMFADMPPARKVAFLKSGAMDAVINCPAATPDCDTAEVKTRLLAHYEKEAETAQTMQDVRALSSGLRDLGTIATNLGVDSPELQFALSTGQSVSNAFLAFTNSPPNIIGGIAALSGIFGKKKDPAQERHIALMSYLSRQFEQVNAKLDVILENQQRIVEGIQGLSEQISKSTIHLDQRLDALQDEVVQTSYNVRRLIWVPWQDCYLVYEKARFDSDAIDPITLQFRTLNDLENVLYSRASAAKRCLNTALGAFVSSISASERFGQFGDIRSVVENGALWETKDNSSVTELSGIRKEQTEIATRYVSALQQFLEERHDPSRQVLSYWANRNGGMANAFALLSRPMADLEEWKFAKSVLGTDPFLCGQDHPAAARLEPLLCRSASDQSAVYSATLHFETALSIDAISDVAGWMMVLAQLADFYREFPTESWMTIDQLLVAPTPDESRGEELLRKTIEVLDVALASSAATYGTATAEGVLNLLYAEGDALAAEQESAIKLLGANPILASNFALLLLDDPAHYATDTNGQKPIFYDYALAYDQAVQQADFDPWMFRALFGEDDVFAFARTEGGLPAMLVQAGQAQQMIPLPRPFEYRDGILSWPPSHLRLLHLRSMLVDQWGGYSVMDTLSANEKAALLSAL